MAEVPEDLAQWFETGTGLADRYGMPRLDFRWRVVEVFWVRMIEEDEDDGIGAEPYVANSRIREFKSRKRAYEVAEEWQRENGRPVLVQAAVVFWMTQEELDAIPEWVPPAGPRGGGERDQKISGSDLTKAAGSGIVLLPGETPPEEQGTTENGY